jgi:ParB-like chromosome segregation protein Spo0J
MLAGNLRFQACRKLGWKTIAALVLAGPGNEIDEETLHQPEPRPVKS